MRDRKPTGHHAFPVTMRINSRGYGIREVFNCSREEEAAFWYRYMLPYALFSPFRKDAARVIRRLHQEGHSIIPVTSRAKTNEKTFIGKLQRSLVKLRLRVGGIPYQQIVFCSYEPGSEERDKVAACIEHKLDIIIEDKKNNAISIQQQTGTRVLLFATRNNADIGSGEMRRFVNFSDLYNGIREYQEAIPFVMLHRKDKEQLTTAARQEYYETFREHLKQHIYDAEIVGKRGRRLKRVIRLGKWPFDKLFKHTILGAENIPSAGGFIFTVNHRELMDIPLVIRAAGSRLYHPIIKASFLDTAAEGLLTDLGCIFVDRHNKSSRERARLIAIQRLLQGHDIIICPEGTRNKSARLLLDFDFGAVSIAQNAGRPIVPCAIYHQKGHKVIKLGKTIEVDIHDNLAHANQLLLDRTTELLADCHAHWASIGLEPTGKLATKEK